jgi:carbonic anhydrase/acetyltransferase-like protein (isoleucine patch superfamily)
MPLFSCEGRRPHVHPEAWIAPTATPAGDVVVEAGASAWVEGNPAIYRELARRQAAGVAEVDA